MAVETVYNVFRKCLSATQTVSYATDMGAFSKGHALSLSGYPRTFPKSTLICSTSWPKRSFFSISLSIFLHA